jgi:serine protease Do
MVIEASDPHPAKPEHRHCVSFSCRPTRDACGSAIHYCITMPSKRPAMHLLFAQLLSLITLTTPLASCSRDAAPNALRSADQIYTLADYRTIDRDSVNAAINGSRRNAITTAVAKASPAVVGINVVSVVEQRYNPWNPFADDPFFGRLFGDAQGGTRVRRIPIKALGSGFLITKDGYILTNDHVAGNATKIIVTTTDGKEYDGKLVGTDPTADIALIKIDGSNLPFIPLGNSSDLAVGEWAIAMGNPFGLFDINDKPTVTVGVISNTGVNLGLEEGHNYRGMIQTDAAISSGNSGGPLLNANGDCVGVNAVIRSTAQSYEGAGSIGIGFAIPIDKVKRVVTDLKRGVTTQHATGELGFRVQELTDEIRQYFRMPESANDRTRGVVVTDVLRNSAADKAGLEPGDVITAIDGEKIRRPEELQSVIAERVAGDQLRFTVLRGGGSKTFTYRVPGQTGE